jgi:lipopolysaccharide biosynthesis glycosyltransferase
LQIYCRLFAAFFLPDQVKRVLYLDADTIVINSLEELYHMDLQGNYFLACIHIRKVLIKINRIQLGIKKKYPYINSGVMLMNLEE